MKSLNVSHKFGIELEFTSSLPQTQIVSLLNTKLGEDLVSHAGWQRQSFSPNNWILTTDGSIKNLKGDKTKGDELVSPPLKGKKGMLELKRVLTALQDFPKKGFPCLNKSCSVHVHISTEDLAPWQITGFYETYRYYEPQILNMMPESRKNNTERNGESYCASVVDLSFEEKVSESLDNRKYYSVNIPSNIPTIEFRLHQGSLNYYKIRNWILILFALKETVKETSFMEPSFLDFLNSRNKRLAKAYLARVSKFSH